jgi:hypothetical protein
MSDKLCPQTYSWKMKGSDQSSLKRSYEALPFCILMTVDGSDGGRGGHLVAKAELSLLFIQRRA